MKQMLRSFLECWQLAALCTVSVFLLSPNVAAAKALAKMEVGKVAVLKGQAQRISMTGVSEALKAGMPVFQGDSLVTAGASALRVLLKDKSTLTIAPSSKMVLSN